MFLGQRRLLRSQKIDECSECILWYMDDGVIARIICQEEALSDGADAEDATRIDNVLSPKAYDIIGWFPCFQNSGLDAREPKGHHERLVGKVIHMGVMVIGLEIDDLVQIEHVQFVVSSYADAVVCHILPKESFVAAQR